MNRIMEKDAVISGVGRSATGRRLGRPGLDLTLDACLAAIAAGVLHVTMTSTCNLSSSAAISG